MCGRFTLTAPRAELARLLAAELPDEELPARYNIAPSQEVAAAVEQDGVRCLRGLHWGLVPSWSKDRSAATRLINARSETVAEKPSFRAAFRARRCLVPMSGFFEWQREGRERLPWYFCSLSGEPLAAAAIWERWSGPDGAPFDSVALLTTAANGVMEPVHHRMPVLLDEAGRAIWMQGAAERRQLEALLQPAPEPLLQRWRVSRAVNRASHQGPDCIQPAPPEGLFEDPAG